MANQYPLYDYKYSKLASENLYEIPKVIHLVTDNKLKERQAQNCTPVFSTRGQRWLKRIRKLLIGICLRSPVIHDTFSDILRMGLHQVSLPALRVQGVMIPSFDMTLYPVEQYGCNQQIQVYSLYDPKNSESAISVFEIAVPYGQSIREDLKNFDGKSYILNRSTASLIWFGRDIARILTLYEVPKRAAYSSNLLYSCYRVIVDMTYARAIMRGHLLYNYQQLIRLVDCLHYMKRLYRSLDTENQTTLTIPVIDSQVFSERLSNNGENQVWDEPVQNVITEILTRWIVLRVGNPIESCSLVEPVSDELATVSQTPVSSSNFSSPNCASQESSFVSVVIEDDNDNYENSTTSIDLKNKNEAIKTLSISSTNNNFKGYDTITRLDNDL